uniref:DnaJ homolog subfamily C member 1 n=1 Tax=Caenorhabditis japonica TaxID=281687 RepID=A0A8R1E006_CAEJA
MRVFFLLLTLPLTVFCQWTTEDLALYDLVEEVGVNFYEWFDIPREATPTQVKKAYRKLTLEWHPDRNSAPDATEKFRQVAGIYEVLKTAELREKYDNILEHGMPSWRQPLYYYRRMRKLEWYESVLVLLFIATIAHYLMMWAAYFEKTLVYKQNVKKTRKTKKDDPAEAEKLMREALEEFLPKYSELLPIILARGTVNLCKNLALTAKEAMEKKEPEPEEPTEELLAQQRREKRAAAPPQPEFKFEVAQGLKAVTTNDPNMEKKYAAESAVVAQKQSGSSWTPEELAHLVRLSTEKYPAGTPNRWEQMGRVLNRTPEDVIAMAGKMKQMKQEDYTKLLMTSIQQSVPAEEKEKCEEEWSQEEQKVFEKALQKFPKGTDERWERISEEIGTKSKKQVMVRFKQLSEMIRKKKTENLN